MPIAAVLASNDSEKIRTLVTHQKGAQLTASLLLDCYGRFLEDAPFLYFLFKLQIPGPFVAI